MSFSHPSTSHPVISAPASLAARRAFATTRAASTDAHTLALIASSLVAATAVAFVAMVVTAWPARATERMEMAALPSAVTLSDVTGPSVAPVEPQPAPARTAALGTLPLPAQACGEALAGTEREMNATLARIESLGETDAPAQCAAFRVHMTAIQQAASTVDRCVAGPERRTKVNFLRQSLSEWRGVVVNGCR